MKLVLVRWRDARGGVTDGWRHIAREIAGLKVWHAESVGWVAHEDNDRLVVVPHRAGDGLEDGDGEISIPRAWIESVTELVEKRERRARRKVEPTSAPNADKT